MFRPILAFVSFQLAVENLKLTYAMLYCDNGNGLAKRLLNINQSNRLKRALTFLLCNYFFSCSEYEPILFHVFDLVERRNTSLHVAVDEVSVITGSANHILMPHKS